MRAACVSERPTPVRLLEPSAKTSRGRPATFQPPEAKQTLRCKCALPVPRSSAAHFRSRQAGPPLEASDELSRRHFLQLVQGIARDGCLPAQTGSLPPQRFSDAQDVVRIRAVAAVA